MKKIIKLICILIVSQNIFSQENPESQIITVTNLETGIKDYEYDISNDRYSIDVAYSVNPNLMRATDLSGFRGQLTWFASPFSYVAFASKTTAKISKISTLRGNFDRDSETFDILELGIGLSRRSTLINIFLKNENIYDEAMFSANYVTASSSIFEESFSGIGLTAGYGLFYRTSKNFHWLLRADYHLNSIEFFNTQTNQDFEIATSWVATSFGFGFYF